MKNTFVYNQFKEPAYLNLEDYIQSIGKKKQTVELNSRSNLLV